MELLICITDKTSVNPLHDPVLPKAGDVIHYHSQSGNWGTEELRNPDWRIFSVPGLTEDEAYALTAWELPGPNPGSQLLQYRGMSVDLSRLGAGTTIDLETFRAAVTVKAPVSHPDVIGPATHTIG